jgi:hypothetical protein
MPLVYTPLGVTPHQVDDFSEGCERSVKGALHFSPEATKVITEDELKHVQVAHTDFYAKLVVIDPKMKPESAKVAAAKPLTVRQKKLAGQKVSRNVAAAVDKAFVLIEEPKSMADELSPKKNKSK